MSTGESRAERAERLRDFLRTIRKPGVSIDAVDEGTSLVGYGLIDSLAVLEIVGWLERTWGLDFGDSGFDPGDLATMGGILDLVERHRPG